jgi:sugar lactone lactonase YvrE
MRSLVVLLVASVHSLASEKIVLVAGGERAGLKEPFGFDFTADGKIVIAEFGAHKISLIDANGKVTTKAGTGVKGFVDGPAEKAQFNGPHNLVVAKSGDIYVADTLNHAVRKIDGRTGAVSTVAGTGMKGFSGDGGPAKNAAFNELYHVALDPKRSGLYVADLGNRRIRKIDLNTGTVTTVAGDGKKGVPPDGAPALEASLVDPRACALDGKGRLYILERGGHALRVVEGGKIRTVVGAGKAGFTGDGGPAAKATLNSPKFVWVDKNDDVLIADTGNHVIRKYVAKDGSIQHVAGTGIIGSKGLDGPPLNAQLSQPHGVAVSPDGVLFIADSENNRLLRIAK